MDDFDYRPARKTRSYGKLLLIPVVGLASVLLLSTGWSRWNSPSTVAREEAPPIISNFHLLVSSPGADINLCKLFLSATANGYPNPILIGWEDKMNFEEAKQIEKLKTTKDYLSKLQRAGGHDKDIVLIVDGIDVMFQLGPDVLLSNYFEAVQDLDRHVQLEYDQPDVRHTILFGADKHCWPDPLEWPTCWMVPKSNLDSLAYGPYTSDRLSDSASHFSTPRWLNSGTIMGPVDDLLRMYQSVLDHVQHDTARGFAHRYSEQSHFGAVYVLQEQIRLAKRQDIVEERFKDTLAVRSSGGDRLQVPAKASHELHMGLDYSASLFMSLIWQEPFTMWTSPVATEVFNDASADERKLQSFYQQPLPSILRTSQPPYAGLNDTKLNGMDWPDLSFLHNIATRSIPPVIHFTLDELRDPWWEKMWFQDKVEYLREARMEEGKQPRQISGSEIDGRQWYHGQHVSPISVKEKDARNVSLLGAGFWAAEGQWISWEHTCEIYEQWLYA